MAFSNYLLLGFVILVVTSSFARAKTSADLNDEELAYYQQFFKENISGIGEDGKAECTKVPPEHVKSCEEVFEILTSGDLTVEGTKQILQILETVEPDYIAETLPEMKSPEEKQ